VEQRARTAPRLPEMQGAGGGADVLDVLRRDRSQELTGRGRAPAEFEQQRAISRLWCLTRVIAVKLAVTGARMTSWGCRFSAAEGPSGLYSRPRRRSA